MVSPLQQVKDKDGEIKSLKEQLEMSTKVIVLCIITRKSNMVVLLQPNRSFTWMPLYDFVSEI